MKKENIIILNKCNNHYSKIPLSKSQKEMIMRNSKDIVFEDMSDYKLLGKIEDLDEYITETGLDETRMMSQFKKEKFLKKSDVKSTPSRDSVMDVPEAELFVRYQYEGPQDSKNRDFCAYMMSRYRNEYFRMEDINYMTTHNPNNDFRPYNYWLYAGSYGCRHKWQAYFFSFKDEIGE